MFLSHSKAEIRGSILTGFHTEHTQTPSLAWCFEAPVKAVRCIWSFYSYGLVLYTATHVPSAQAS